MVHDSVSNLCFLLRIYPLPSSPKSDNGIHTIPKKVLCRIWGRCPTGRRGRHLLIFQPHLYPIQNFCDGENRTAIGGHVPSRSHGTTFDYGRQSIQSARVWTKVSVDVSQLSVRKKMDAIRLASIFSKLESQYLRQIRDVDRDVIEEEITRVVACHIRYTYAEAGIGKFA